MNDITLLATLTCPNPTCRHQQRAVMPTTFCQLYYTCEKCSLTHKHQQGDCCVFCSYADKPCPPIQRAGSCCASNHSDQGASALQGERKRDGCS
ncbi:GDCCVxC domain-containing (seleno)protein [Thermosporothrix hazakensis]|uniref:GDCCVxC domain-containing (seleno)protein n=1 Tax=Thermosporothrix hazakensis TaxID=644383 RepID=UPI000DABC250